MRPSGNFVRPGAAGGAVVLDDVAAEADPGAHPAQEAGALAQPQQRVQRRAVEQPEVPGVGLEVDLGEAAHDRVEPARGGELHARLALPHAPLGDDDVRAVAPASDQLGDQLGRVLEVAVEHHHRVADRVVEAGGDRHLVAERPREVQHAHARVASRRSRRGSRRCRPSSRRRRRSARRGSRPSAEATRSQNSRASPSSSSIGATTLSSRNSRIGASLASADASGLCPSRSECEHVFVSCTPSSTPTPPSPSWTAPRCRTSWRARRPSSATRRWR